MPEIEKKMKSKKTRRVLAVLNNYCRETKLQANSGVLLVDRIKKNNFFHF